MATASILPSSAMANQIVEMVPTRLIAKPTLVSVLSSSVEAMELSAPAVLITLKDAIHI
jgi:hypothetical protein